MKNFYGRIFAVVLATAAAVSGIAYAEGFGAGHGHGHGSLVPWIVRRMVTREQMRSAVAAEKPTLKKMHSEVRRARERLTQDLVAGKDTTADVQALETAQNNLLAEKVKLAQNILKNLSADQRKQVTEFTTKLRSMRKSQHEQMSKLMQQYGVSKGGKGGAGGADAQ